MKRKNEISAGRRAQRGNAFLETALIFLPMIALMFGLVDISLVVFIQSTLTSATREGARFATTYQTSYNGTSCATSQASCITQAVQYNAFGFLSGSNSNHITINYYTANNLTNPVETCNSGTCTQTGAMPQTLSNGVVVHYVNQPGNIVEVVVAGYPWNWLVPLRGFSAGTGLTLAAASTDVLGALAVGTTTPPNP